MIEVPKVYAEHWDAFLAEKYGEQKPQVDGIPENEPIMPEGIQDDVDELIPEKYADEPTEEIRIPSGQYTDDGQLLADIEELDAYVEEQRSEEVP